MLQAFPLTLLLTGKAESYAGNGLEPRLRDRLSALPAAGFAVNPLRAFLKVHLNRLTYRGLTFDAFKFRSLIKNIHKFLLNIGRTLRFRGQDRTCPDV